MPESWNTALALLPERLRTAAFHGFAPRLRESGARLN